MLEKSKVINVVYIVFGIALLISLFTMLANALYIKSNMFTYSYEATVNFIDTYNLFSWIILSVSFFCVAVFVYNFFAKKKLNLVELVLIAIDISVVVVAIVFCSIDRANASASDLNSIFISYIELFYEYLSILVVLFATKIFVTITNKKGTNKGIENIN